MTTHTKSAITPKALLFIEEFLKDFNGTQAAIRAGYSERSAQTQAYRMLINDDVKAIIEQRKAELMAGKKMTLEKWVDIVTKLALYDPRKMFDTFGNPHEIPELGRLSSLALAGFEIEELFDGKGEERKKIGYARKVKLLDRTPYIMALGKYLNAFPAKKLELAPPMRQINPAFKDLSVEQRMQLREQITQLIESTIDNAKGKTVTPHTNGHTNGHGAA